MDVCVCGERELGKMGWHSRVNPKLFVFRIEALMLLEQTGLHSSKC